MKYRIRRENEKYRAEVGKENKFGKLNWIPIEEDNNDLVARCYYYSTIEAAKEACKNHHIARGYDKIDNDVVEEFDL